LRIAGKLKQLYHVVAQPAGSDLKKIDPKYFGETLDPHRRPKEELDELYKVWEQKWNAKEDVAPNFYDWVGTIKAKATVHQFNEKERLDYVATIKDGQLTGQHVVAKSMDFAFVLDGSGTFYTAPKQTSGDTRIHHSSFLSGAPVQCAGVFFCNTVVAEHTKGIFYVKDYSGHYQPKVKEVLRLRKRLMDLGEGKITLWYYAGKAQPLYKGAISEFYGWIAKEDNRGHITDQGERGEVERLLKLMQ
jgi:hypothetical protein